MINPSYVEETEREREGEESREIIASPQLAIRVYRWKKRYRERETRADDDDATVTVGKLPSYDESGWRR